MAWRMTGMALVMALALPASSPVQAAKSPKLAKCDGKHRRSANPYGSILPSVDPLAGTSVPPAGTAPKRSTNEVFPTDVPAIPTRAPKRKGKRGPKSIAPDSTPTVEVPPISNTAPPVTHRSC